MSAETAHERRLAAVIREARAWKALAERNKAAAEHVDRERVRLAGIAVKLDSQLTALRAEAAELPELRAALAAARAENLDLQLRSLESLLTLAHTIRELREESARMTRDLSAMLDQIRDSDELATQAVTEAREAEQRAREAGRAAEDQLSAHIIKSNDTLAAFATAARIREEQTASVVHAAREVVAAYLTPGPLHANIQRILRVDWRTLSEALQHLTKAESELPVVMYGADSCA